MAKLKAYKFVNAGSSNSGLEASAARTQTLALNRVGGTLTSIGNIISDIEEISIQSIKNDNARIKAERRRERRRKDAGAEKAQEDEFKKAGGSKKIQNRLKKKGGKSLGLDWLENFLGPLASVLVKVGAFALTTEIMAYLSDEKNITKITTFLERARFVFDKLKGFGEQIGSAIGTGLDFIFGKESTIEERLEAFGKVALAIAGIGATLNAVNFVSDIFDTGEDIVDVVDAVDDVKPDKPRTKPKPGYYDDAVEASRRNADRIRKSRPNIFQRGFGFLQEQGSRFVNSLKNLPGWATEQYGRLSDAAKAGWNNTVKASQALAEKGQKWASAAGSSIKGGFDNLSSGAKNFFIEKILTPIRGLIDPIAKKASGIGTALFDRLKALPGMEKAGEILKKKGIGGFGDIAGAGSKLGKRAAAILPVIGGIVNLAFAYDRAANGDSIGALIEGTSGILDIAGLATAGAGNVASMLLDGYMFVRDFIPQLQQGEEAVVDAVGARGLKTSIDNILKKLPNIGELITMFMGKSKDEEDAGREPQQELFLGGVVKGIGKAVSGIGKTVGKIASNPLVQTAASFIPGAAPIMAGINMATGLMSGNPMNMLGAAAGMIPGLGGIMSGPLGNIAGNLMSGNFLGAATTGLGMINPAMGQLAGSLLSGGFNPMSAIGTLAEQYGMGGAFKAITGAMGGDYNAGIQELGSQLGVDPKVIGGVQKVSSKALSEGGISAEYAMQTAMEFIPVPMVLDRIVPMQVAVPINTGGGVVAATPSSLTQRIQ